MVVIDGLDQVLQLILPHIKRHLSRPPTLCEKGSFKRPFKLAVTGLQGSGKSTWSSQIVESLNKAGLRARAVSLDDLYLPHHQLVAVRDNHPTNKLLRSRGQPGTHDLVLAKWFFQQFDEPSGHERLFPIFDKSKFSGEGDRLPRSEWHRSAPDEVIDVLVLEGWCVGFQALSTEEIQEAWSKSQDIDAVLVDDESLGFPIETLSNHSLDDLCFINEQLGTYCDVFMGPQHWDYLVHLDTDDLRNVYSWRLEQEKFLRQAKGTGMTDEMVVEFIKGYMPAYELYLGRLRQGFFGDVQDGWGRKQQLSIKLDPARKAVGIQEL
ncbi:hypothetical protein ABW19_dt0202380 [Dactylella cylindrospora]|nr:hypothetical protein ABW19_dt0202380 [Dactylella cylindrospora]